MEHRQLGFMQLTIIVGFGLFYTWYLVSFFGIFLGFPAQAGFVQRRICQIVFFAASIVATEGILIAFRRANSSAIGHTRFLYLASLVPGSFVPACAIFDALGFALPMPVVYLASALSGAALAIGFMLWEDIATHGYLRRGVLAHGIVFSSGGILFVLSTAFLTSFQLAVLSELALVAATALLTFITPRCDHLESRPVEPVKQHLNKSWHVDVVSIAISCAFGYAFIMLYRMDAATLLAVMAIAIVLDLALAGVLGRGKWIPFVGTIRICLAVVACALLLYACPGDIAHTVSLCAIVVFWFLFRTVNGGSRTDLAMRNGYSVLYAATRGKMAANIGFTAGLVLGLCVVAFPVEWVAEIYAPLALVALLVIAASFFLPYEDATTTAAYKTLAFVDMHEPYDSMQPGVQELSEKVAQTYKLSPRESEVVVYVMKGRNAKHVAEKLFISESTAKTHIANIYRKAGVHSQQELLDKLETLR